MAYISVREVFRAVVVLRKLEGGYEAKVADLGDDVGVEGDGFWGVVDEVDSRLRHVRRVLEDLSGRLRDPVGDIVHFLVMDCRINGAGSNGGDGSSDRLSWGRRDVEAAQGPVGRLVPTEQEAVPDVEIDRDDMTMYRNLPVRGASCRLADWDEESLYALRFGTGTRSKGRGVHHRL